MPIFTYTSLTRTGRQERSTIDAESLAEARGTLRAQGVNVLEIRAEDAPGEDPAAGGDRTIRFLRVKQRDLAVAVRQLATLLRAGMPLVPALGALVEQLAGHPLAKVFARVRDRVSEGHTLGSALAEHPRIFSEPLVSMVRAGEAAGALENVLSRLAEMLEKRVNLVNRVRGAMAYPLFMAAVGAGVIIFLLSYVIPSISKLFLEMNRELPWPTVMLMTVSEVISSHFWLLALAIAAVVAGWWLWVRTAAGRGMWDRVKLKAPLFGDLVLKMAVSRFARMLAVLLASGVAILDALEIVKRVVGNSVIADALDKVKESVGHGDSIADPLRRSGVFPPIVFHMIAVGESSGSVEEGLQHVAEAYDNEVEAKVGALTSLLEPLMILFMGVIVGFMVLAILLPIFDINQAIR